MAREEDPLELADAEPDERLLGEDLGHLPTGAGQPPPRLPESPVRRQVVRLGAAMTGITLIGGLALSLLGLIEVIANGGVVWFVVLVVGVVLATTHWGWVHVAELTGNTIELRRQTASEEGRRQWLAEIEPYPRWEVRTQADTDGSITIETVRYRPVGTGERRFTFARELEASEVHSGDEPGATVAERAELLRRQAALETEQARLRFEAARDDRERKRIAQEDDRQRRAALHAGSQALSDRINSNLDDPPLTE
jgi:signal transduction histidine kinase